MSTRFEPLLEEIDEHFRVSLKEDGEEIFSTTLIPPRCRLIAEMIHSTLEVAISFGFLGSENPDQDSPT